MMSPTLSSLATLLVVLCPSLAVAQPAFAGPSSASEPQVEAHATAPVFGFGGSLEFAAAFGPDNVVLEGRLSGLAQFGTLTEKKSGKYSGTYLSAGLEVTTGGIRQYGSPDFIGRSTVGPTFRANWGTGPISESGSVIPRKGVYAKATPFVSFGDDTGFGARGGLGYNLTLDAGTLFESEDHGQGAVRGVGVLMAIPATLFLHGELFIETERVGGGTDIRGGAAFGLGF